ncbi:MAG TPA: tRNA pseudouridine(55) synthase TruB [Anaerolineae bacterium]|nr:tRNA pseudouridine(55) synthase TruB [Anaerolineae bacterium]HQI84721.1 tRNA pseudouridine(55) synthase TruB [Anaerolineae bacterium]
MNGLLVVNKPTGMTSHDVVNTVRRLAGMRRVGHAGTLDPMATGVLVVVVGAATRLVQFIDGCDKTYRATLCLGETTTTYDADGDLVERRPVTVSQAEVEAALAQFQGDILQIPPMHSAVKIKGQKLYKLAHRGKEVEREPRPVTIHRLDVLEWTLPDVTIEVVCSAGTYIRSLAHDLGQALGCGAHLTSLIRTAAGAFGLKDSRTLEELRALADAGRLAEALLPPQTALAGLPVITLTPEQERAVGYGQTFLLDGPSDAAMVQAHDAAGRLVAVLLPVEPGVWRPKLVFSAAE